MAKPSKGDVVLIEYTIWFYDNEGKTKIFDTTNEEEAKKEGIYNDKKKYGELPVILGSGSLLEAVEEALLDMEEGEERIIEVPPERGYGEWKRELLIKVSKKKLRDMGVRPRVGEEISASGRKGRITRVTERFAYIDFNHPLAGKKLKIKIKLNKILKTDKDKIKYIATRYLRLPVDSIEVEGVNNEYTIKLPSEVLLIRDLEAILLNMLESIYNMTNAKKINITINVEFKGKEGEKTETEETEEEAATEKESNQ